MRKEEEARGRRKSKEGHISNDSCHLIGDALQFPAVIGIAPQKAEALHISDFAYEIYCICDFT